MVNNETGEKIEMTILLRHDVPPDAEYVYEDKMEIIHIGRVTGLGK